LRILEERLVGEEEEVARLGIEQGMEGSQMRMEGY